ncbi:MAG: proton-conducting transporter membrane subunit [Pseudomonadota bacterium]|jgi:NAD(P)H-quinone oxidoreductase subunit 5|nr:proton-conducting membrane transporter [Alphaproteobacteria bacterium]
MIHRFLDFHPNLDAFAMIMIGLVIFIGLCVFSFSSRYMKGDKKYQSFCLQLILLIFSVSITVSTDDLAILFFSWCFNNILLTNLMIHKASWRAAKNSGILALKNFLLGTISIGIAFTIFYLVTGEKSIKAILDQDPQSDITLFSLILILIGAMTQSGIWPFHRWLISSLNSPTPVSAIMHAGLVNGGGVILIRFSPFYLQHSTLLSSIFIIGIATSLLGTLWKLMQSDIKRMLACSTMGQMGFMLAQCGLGLFPAAITHLLWHSLFKAYLFLSSGSAAQEKRFELNAPINPFIFSCSLLCGVIGSIGFGYSSDKSWLANDTTLVLMVISLLTASQFAISIIRRVSIKDFFLTLVTTLLVSLIYGFSVKLIGAAVEPMHLMHPQPLSGIHLLGIFILTATWLFQLLLKNRQRTKNFSSLILKYYVKALNASQPHPNTVTTHRNYYKYS